MKLESSKLQILILRKHFPIFIKKSSNLEKFLKIIPFFCSAGLSTKHYSRSVFISGEIRPKSACHDKIEDIWDSENISRQTSVPDWMGNWVDFGDNGVRDTSRWWRDSHVVPTLRTGRTSRHVGGQHPRDEETRPIRDWGKGFRCQVGNNLRLLKSLNLLNELCVCTVNLLIYSQICKNCGGKLGYKL